MSSKKMLFGLIGLVLVAWLVTPFIVAHLYTQVDERGQFGDLFGSINSLFTGLAFAGLFYTVHLQAKQLRIQQMELKTQRQELRLQRQEMAASRAELANQVRMQRALTLATVAQINVAAINAEIEAKKMQSKSVAPSGRQAYWTYIETAASTLSELASNVKEEIQRAG